MISSDLVFVIGLSGGIGSGKSTVSSLLSEKGAVVIDSDEVVRELLRSDQTIKKALSDRFGTRILSSSGEVDRAELASLVFDDAEDLRLLNSLLHPLVYADVESQIAKLPEDSVVIVEVPLLIETGYDKFDAVVIVDAPEEAVLQRLKSNRNMTEADIRLRMAAQINRDDRNKRADFLITNDKDLKALNEQIDEVWNWIEASRTS